MIQAVAEPEAEEEAQPEAGAEPQAVPSRIVITFEAPGSAGLQLNFEGIVTTAQVMSAGAWLSWYAEDQFTQIREQRARDAQASVQENRRIAEAITRGGGIRTRN